MSAEGLRAPAPLPVERRPLWRNPFVVAFAVGLVSLTVLPVLQARFLSAPAPLRVLAPWSLPTLAGGAVGSDSLKGRVWLAMLVPGPCDEPCRARAAQFGNALPHLDDLGEKVELVSFVLPEAAPAVQGLAKTSPRWHLASGSREAMAPVLWELRAGWEGWAHTDAGSTLEDFSALPAVAVVDQEGSLRGFWRDDAAGRGNAINAARLLARSGPHP